MGDININGGSHQIGAVGQHVRGRISNSGGRADADPAQIERRIAELRELVDRYAARIADPSAARDAVDAATEEVRNGGGQTRGFRVALNAVAGAAPGVTAVTQFVRELLQLVSPTP